jgi:hypothetical protein
LLLFPLQLLVDCFFFAAVAVPAATIAVAVIVNAATITAVTITTAAVGKRAANKPLAPSPPLVSQHSCEEIRVNCSCQDKKRANHSYVGLTIMSH